MATITVEQFVGEIVAWAGRRDSQFKYNWPVKGGWEGWVQVDLTAYILSEDSAVEILREQPVFTSPYMRCDLLLNTALDTDYRIPVEIKAQSFDNRGEFVTGVQADIDKLNTDRNADYSESTCVVLGIPFNEETLGQLLSITQDGHRIFAAVFIGEVACAVAVWTEVDGWLQPTAIVEHEASGALATPTAG
jgi:hypothetical protein